ncbi:PAAR domain-containing protein [Paraburkholderia phytofirmans]|uniref:PAAR domain-containing protein n=1 Tax=Paraburkholderia phytofirmans TaxID=261302 RepID=A0ABW9BTT0_9BURK
MMRRIAVVGDRLERGGEILPYAGPVFTMGDAGRQVALIGGTAYCEACKSAGTIAKAGGPRRIDFMGETAADRDIVLCKCPSPPHILATLSGESWCDDMAESLGEVASSPTVSGGVASVAIGAYDEQIRATGRGASAGYPYFIETAHGRTFSGRLDHGGHLPRVHSDAADDYTVHWGDAALAKQEV